MHARLLGTLRSDVVGGSGSTVRSDGRIPTRSPDDRAIEMTSTPDTAETRTATRADRPVLGAIIGSAFFSDPVFTWMIPDDSRRAANGSLFFEQCATAFEPLGACQLLGDADGNHLGAALWEPLGAQAIPDDAAEAFMARLGELCDPYADRWFRFVELTDATHPEKPCNYLFAIGIDPKAQGRGRGSAMLSNALRRCDAGREPAYLEATSPDNRRLYERHGFEVIGEIVLPDGPTMWPMWREPAADAR